MKSRVASLILSLIAVILLHDLSMAVVGHPAMPDDTEHHGRHAPQGETHVPEECGTVRLANGRVTAPEPPVSDPLHSTMIAPNLLAFAAISEPFLVVPVTLPASACLAVLQVFRL